MTSLVSRCAFCGLEAKRQPKCAKCLDTTYCNVACQRSDWKDHRLLCSDRLSILNSVRPTHIPSDVEQEWGSWRKLHTGMLMFLFAAVVNNSDHKVITLHLTYVATEIPANKFQIQHVEAGCSTEPPMVFPSLDRPGKYSGYYVAVCEKAFGKILRTVPLWLQTDRPIRFFEMNAHSLSPEELGQNEVDYILLKMKEGKFLNDRQFAKWLKKQNP